MGGGFRTFAVWFLCSISATAAPIAELLSHRLRSCVGVKGLLYVKAIDPRQVSVCSARLPITSRRHERPFTSQSAPRCSLAGSAYYNHRTTTSRSVLRRSPPILSIVRYLAPICRTSCMSRACHDITRQPWPSYASCSANQTAPSSFANPPAIMYLPTQYSHTHGNRRRSLFRTWKLMVA